MKKVTQLSKVSPDTRLILDKLEAVEKEFLNIKEDIFSMKDELMGEIKTVREEQTLQSSTYGRLLDLEDKMEKVEKIHPHFQHQ